MIETKRHNLDLYWNNCIIIAPRYFVIDDYKYFVHIVDPYCQRVLLYLNLPIALCRDKHNVSIYGYFKLYSNTKGIYFKFKHNNRYERIYICG